MNSKKIALFGPYETSQRIATEALRRGHDVTAIVTDEKAFTLKHPNLKVVTGDVRKKEDVRRFSKNHDVVIDTHEPTKAKPSEHVEIIRSLIEGVKGSGVYHLISVAHPLGQFVEKTEEAYNEFKPILKAQKDALKLLQNEDQIHWGYAHSIEPEKMGGEPGKYGATNEILFTTPEGDSRISANRYASAIIDEVEKDEVMAQHGKEEREY